MTRAIRFCRAVTLALGGFFFGIAGECLVFDWPWYVNLGIGVSLLSVCAVSVLAEWWRTRAARRAARNRDFATAPDRWEADEAHNRIAAERQAFFDSPEGWLLLQMPAAINDTVRILPVEQRPTGDPMETGEFFIQIDDDRVAVFRVDFATRARTWRQRVAEISLWLATRSWLAGRPGATRVFEWTMRRIYRIPRKYRPAASGEQAPGAQQEPRDPAAGR